MVERGAIERRFKARLRLWHSKNGAADSARPTAANDSIGILSLPKDVLSLIAEQLPDRVALACTCKELAELVRPVRIVGDDAPIPEGVLYARVESRNLAGLGAALPAAREIRLVDCHGTLTLPANTRVRHVRLRLHESTHVALAAADVPADTPGMTHCLTLRLCTDIRIHDARFAPLQLECTDGELPPGAAAALLSATHVRLSGLNGPLPHMPAVTHLELVMCSGLPHALYIPSVRHVVLELCSGLTSLSAPEAEYARVEECESLTTVVDLPAALIVRVELSHAIRSLPAMPHARKVTLGGLVALEEVGCLDEAEELTIWRCRALASLPQAMPCARRVWVLSCRALRSLPQVSEACRVTLVDCPVIDCPDLRVARAWDVKSCPRLRARLRRRGFREASRLRRFAWFMGCYL